MKKFLEFFQEDNGRFSSTRLMFLLTGHAIVAGWLLCCIFEKKLVGIDPSIIAFYGVPATVKVVGKFSEEKVNTTN